MEVVLLGALGVELVVEPAVVPVEAGGVVLCAVVSVPVVLEPLAAGVELVEPAVVSVLVPAGGIEVVPVVEP